MQVFYSILYTYTCNTTCTVLAAGSGMMLSCYLYHVETNLEQSSKFRKCDMVPATSLLLRQMLSVADLLTGRSDKTGKRL